MLATRAFRLPLVGLPSSRVRNSTLRCLPPGHSGYLDHPSLPPPIYLDSRLARRVGVQREGERICRGRAGRGKRPKVVEGRSCRSDGVRGGRWRWCCGCFGEKTWGEVSRELQVSPVDLEEWRRVFLERGQQGLKRRRGDPAERELARPRLMRCRFPLAQAPRQWGA